MVGAQRSIDRSLSNIYAPTPSIVFIVHHNVPIAVDMFNNNTAWRMNELSQSLITIIILALFIYSAFSSTAVRI